VIVNTSNLIKKDINRDTGNEAHRLLSYITKYFSSDGKHYTWAEFCNKRLSAMCDQVLTWSACQFTHHKLEVNNKERTLLNAITGILEALKQFSDPLGKAYSMSPTSPPRVSQKQIINFVDDMPPEKEVMLLAWNL
jgi:hypothetical protein